LKQPPTDQAHDLKVRRIEVIQVDALFPFAPGFRGLLGITMKANAQKQGLRGIGPKAFPEHWSGVPQI
jgi:hypothetical protein